MFFFFFNDTATTEIYTLSLHDALPISLLPAGAKNTRIFRRLFAASGRGDTKATRSMLRTVPLGKQTNFSFRSEEHTSELQSQSNIVCRLLLEHKTDMGVAKPSIWLSSL